MRKSEIPPRPSQEQLQLANLLGLNLAADTFDVAAAQLLDKIAAAIGHEPPEQSSERQQSFAASLGLDVTTDSKRVAGAKIGDALYTKNQEAIASLNLQPGDRVIQVTQFEYEGKLRSLEQEFVVSSIQPNGRVFFKGGNGLGAWPTQLKKPTD